MFTAINTRESYEVLKDLVDRPVLSMNAFQRPRNPGVMYARSKGFVPCPTGWLRRITLCGIGAGRPTTPLWLPGCRALVVSDFTDDRIWDENDWFHAVAYPDEFERPIPSLAWEGYRAGVDDVRYLQALDRAIATAEGGTKNPDPPAGLAESLAKAHDVRKARFESIDGQYCNTCSAQTRCARRDSPRDGGSDGGNSIAPEWNEDNAASQRTNSNKLVYFHKASPS